MPGVDTLMALSNPGWGRRGAYRTNPRFNPWANYSGSYSKPRRKRVNRAKPAAKRTNKSQGVLRRVKTPQGIRFQRGGKFVSTATAKNLLAAARKRAKARKPAAPTKSRKSTARRNPTRRTPNMAKATVRRARRRNPARANRALTKRQKAARKAVRTKRRLGILPARRLPRKGYRRALSRAYRKAWRKPPYKLPARKKAAKRRMAKWWQKSGRRWRKTARRAAKGYRSAAKRKRVLRRSRLKSGKLGKRGRYVWPKGSRLHPPKRRRRRKAAAKGRWVSSIRQLSTETGLVPVRANRRRRRKSRRNAYISTQQPTRINRRRRRRRNSAVRANPRRRRRGGARRNVRRTVGRRRNRSYTRRNFAGGFVSALKAGGTLVGAFVAGAAINAAVGALASSKMGAPIFSKIPIQHMNAAVSALALGAGLLATKKVAALQKYRWHILSGLGANLVIQLFRSYVAPALANTLPPGSFGHNVLKNAGLLPSGTAGIGDLYYGYVDNPYRYMSGMGDPMGRYVEAPMGDLMEAPAGFGAYIQSQQAQPIGELYQAAAGLGDAPGLPEAGSVALSRSPTGVFSEDVFGGRPSFAQ